MFLEPVEDRKSYHVEGVGRQCKGMGEETADELEEEEARVDRDHDLDARRLGHQRLGGPHGEEWRSADGRRRRGEPGGRLMELVPLSGLRSAGRDAAPR